jgi:hypothetical protein
MPPEPPDDGDKLNSMSSSLGRFFGSPCAGTVAASSWRWLQFIADAKRFRAASFLTVTSGRRPFVPAALGEVFACRLCFLGRGDGAATGLFSRAGSRRRAQQIKQFTHQYVVELS